MEITIESLENLKRKIDQIEHDLNEVRKDLEQMTSTLRPKTEVDLCSKIKCVDKEKLKKWFDEWFKQMGIDVQPVNIEELHELCLREGIKPEDNIMSKGIIEMREE